MFIHDNEDNDIVDLTNDDENMDLTEVEIIEVPEDAKPVVEKGPGMPMEMTIADIPRLKVGSSHQTPRNMSRSQNKTTPRSRVFTPRFNRRDSSTRAVQTEPEISRAVAESPAVSRTVVGSLAVSRAVVGSPAVSTPRLGERTGTGAEERRVEVVGVGLSVTLNIDGQMETKTLGKMCD